MSLAANGLTERFAAFQALMKRSVVDAVFARPRGECLCSTVIVNQPVRSHIVHLLSLRRPSTISRFVMSIGVNAVNRMLRRGPRSHVGIEGTEVVTPSFAHRYPSAAVVMKNFRVRVVAPLDHARPYPVFARRLFIDAESMRGVAFRDAFNRQTSTRLRMSVAEICLLHRGVLAAFAPTQPSPLAFAFHGFGDDRQSTVSLSARYRRVVHISHNNIEGLNNLEGSASAGGR